MVNLFEFIINIIQESIILMFLTLYFGCRFSAPKKYLGYIAGVVVNVACITYFNTIYIYEGVLGLIFTLLYFLYSIIFLKGDVFNKLFMSAFINCIVYFLGLFTILCFSILLPESHDSLYNMFTLTRERVLLTVTVQILLITACALLLRFKPKSNLKKRSIAALIIMPVAVELSMIGFADIFIENNSLSFELLLVSTCIMIACISIYYAYIKISDVVAVEAEYAVLQQRYEYDKRRTGEIEEMYSNTCAMRHDLINHFTTVSSLIDNNKKARDYINSVMENQIGELKNSVKTDNDYFDAIANSKAAVCERLGIDVQIRVMNNSLSVLKQDEIAVLFGNLFDNAIEAAKNSSKKTIELDVQTQGEYLSIFMINSIDRSVLKNNNDLKTTKKNKMYHGFGIKNIQRVVNEHKGIINFFEENGYFCCDILI